MAEKISPAATPWWFLILVAANIPTDDWPLSCWSIYGSEKNRVPLNPVKITAHSSPKIWISKCLAFDTMRLKKPSAGKTKGKTSLSLENSLENC